MIDQSSRPLIECQINDTTDSVEVYSKFKDNTYIVLDIIPKRIIRDMFNYEFNNIKPIFCIHRENTNCQYNGINVSEMWEWLLYGSKEISTHALSASYFEYFDDVDQFDLTAIIYTRDPSGNISITDPVCSKKTIIPLKLFDVVFKPSIKGGFKC